MPVFPGLPDPSFEHIAQVEQDGYAMPRYALLDRGSSAVGFDGPSADPVDSTTMDLHRIWLSAGRMILENVNNLDQLPDRAQVVVAPMKVARATGAPTRIFALLPY